MPEWLQWVLAIAMFLLIAGLGYVFLRGIVTSRPKQRIDPEDVEDLEVYFVCGECGTELQVTRLGEIQVPRHCGEPMSVVRRPRQNPVGS